jgi:RHS repeat-associated protein
MRLDSNGPLNRHYYDALDRLVATSNDTQVKFKRFYCGDFLVSETQGELALSFFRASEILLAQHEDLSGLSVKKMLCVDRQNSILAVYSRQSICCRSYTPYGYHFLAGEQEVPLGYIGEYRNTVTGLYVPGNGYRVFNPTLMRFHSPDSLSPFAEGGLNPYAYSKNDPINFQDNNGHWRISSLAPFLGIRISRKSVAVDKGFDFSRKEFPVPPPGYKLIGYHGSKSKHIANLASNGLDPSFIGRNLKVDYDPGFYLSPKLRVARGYAKPSQSFFGFGKKRPNSVGAVFVKDLDAKIPEHHFRYIPQHGVEQEQIVILPRVYSDVLVKPLHSFKRVEKPEIDNIRRR